MTKEEFSELVGKDLTIIYNFNGEIQFWNMREFYFNEAGEIRHDYYNLIMPVFIKNAICVKDKDYYIDKGRVDELNKLFVAITKSVDELGDDATLKVVAEILKETIDYIYAEIIRYER
ncbi:MAG: hypothetical protein MJZ03_03855 [archaeon]|nr:hypothetical protein [archaeon]